MQLPEYIARIERSRASKRLDKTKISVMFSGFAKSEAIIDTCTSFDVSRITL